MFESKISKRALFVAVLCKLFVDSNNLKKKIQPILKKITSQFSKKEKQISEISVRIQFQFLE